MADSQNTLAEVKPSLRLSPSESSIVVVDDASDHPLRITEYGKNFVVTDPSQLSQLDMKTKLAILNDPVLFSQLPEPARALLRQLTALSDRDHQTLAVIPHDDGRSNWTRESRVPRAVAEQERSELSTTLGLDATGEASWDEINDGLRMKIMLETLRPSRQRAAAHADDVEEQLREAADAPREVVADEEELVAAVGGLYLNHRTAAGANALEQAFKLALPAPAPAPTEDARAPLFANMSSHAKLFDVGCVGNFILRLSALFPKKPSMITKKTYRCAGECLICAGGELALPPIPARTCACEYIRGLPSGEIIATCFCDSACAYCAANAASLLCPCAYSELAKTPVALCVCSPTCAHCRKKSLQAPERILHKIDEDLHDDLFGDGFGNEESDAESPEDTPEDSPGKTLEDAPEESPEDSPGEASEDASEGSPEESPENTPKESPETPEESADSDYDYPALAARLKLLRKRRRKLKKKLGPHPPPLLPIIPWGKLWIPDIQ